MKIQKVKFKIGDVVTKETNNFKRLIIHIYHEERSRVLKVIYVYQYELLDNNYRATGFFNDKNIGICSQDRLVSWLKGKRN